MVKLFQALRIVLVSCSDLHTSTHLNSGPNSLYNVVLELTMHVHNMVKPNVKFSVAVSYCFIAAKLRSVLGGIKVRILTALAKLLPDRYN